MHISLEKQSINFSVRVAELAKYLREDNRCFPLADQLLSCGVQAGLAMRSNDRKAAATFVAQSDYIIEMAVFAGYLTAQQSVHVRADCEALIKILNTATEVESEEKSL